MFNNNVRWILKWIDANIKFGSLLGRAKRRKLEKEQDVLRFLEERGGVESNTTKEERIRRGEQLYSIMDLVKKMPSGKTQQFYWNKLIDVLQNLGRQEESLEVGKYYTFKYWAKTRGKYFDVYPVTFILSKEMHHILGINLHWKEAPNFVESMYRNYVYSGFKSRFYEIKEWELEEVMKLPTFMPVML